MHSKRLLLLNWSIKSPCNGNLSFPPFLQGAQLLSHYGVRVPDGTPAKTIKEVSPLPLPFFADQHTSRSVLKSNLLVSLPVPLLSLSLSSSQVVDAANKLKDAKGEVVLKSQILAGGRGLGTFKNGLKGGVHIVKASEIESLASKMLGQVLVTKQTGPQGKPVDTLYVAKKLVFKKEKYFAILLVRIFFTARIRNRLSPDKEIDTSSLSPLSTAFAFLILSLSLSHAHPHPTPQDRKSNGPVMIACSEGGTSIEDLAEKFPDKIVRVPVNALTGITDADALKVAEGLQVAGSKKDAAEMIKSIYRLFKEKDCTLVEINPLAEDDQDRLVAADTKLGFDDNASFRQKDLFAMRDTTQEDPREVAAAKADLNYIGLDGNIGCMVNGAGLAMATMDIIKLHGGAPANFLDVGGNATEAQVVEAFKILTADPQVKALLVNIFGGIARCDVMASGIVTAAKQVGVQVPLVVRLEGTNVAAGKEILQKSGLNVITAVDLDDAAKKAVKAIAGA